MPTLVLRSTLATMARSARLESTTPNSNYNDIDKAVVAVRLTTALTTIRSIASFDLSALPSNARIDLATLSLFYYTRTGGGIDVTGRTVAVHRVSGSFTAEEVTWNRRSTATPWTTPGGDFTVAKATFALPAIESFITLNVFDIFLADGFVDFFLKWDNESDSRLDDVELQFEIGASPNIAGSGATLALVYSVPAPRSIDPGIKPAPVRELAPARTLTLV